MDLAGLASGRVEDVAVAETIDVGSTAHPYAPALDPTGRRLFVANTQATYLSVVDITSGQVTQIEIGSIGGRAITFTTDERYALATVETRSEVVVIDLTTLKETRRIPVGPGPRGLAMDGKDDTLYVTNFDRTIVQRGPDFPGNALTAVDLNSAPLDQPIGEFSYEAVEVGFGPCSVSVLDVATVASRSAEHTTSSLV